MTSLRKILANRRNAELSTGPKTSHGRARASRNALRHGLTLSVLTAPVLSEEVHKFAREIVSSSHESGELYATACQIAEAQTDLNRIRRLRHQILRRAIADPLFESKRREKSNNRVTRRYFKVLERRRLMSCTPLEYRDWIGFDIPDKRPVVLSELPGRFEAISRFERQARRRRTRAIRAYDALIRDSSEHPGVPD
jgi:hypothetical protein